MQVKDIKNPKFLKNLNNDEIFDLCKEIREEIIRK